MRAFPFLTGASALVAALLLAAAPPARAQDAPIGLTAQPGDGFVDLSWNAPPSDDEDEDDEGLVGYRLYRDNDSEPGDVAPLVQIDDPATTTYRDEAVQNGTQYWYAVTALYRDSEEPDEPPEESDFPDQQVVTATPEATDGGGDDGGGGGDDEVSASFDPFGLPLPAGNAATIGLTAAPASSVASVTISYRPGGAQQFTEVNASSQGNSAYAIVVPPSSVTARGVEVRAEVVFDSDMTVVLPGSTPGFESLTVRTEEGFTHQQPGGDDQSAYRLFSFPLDLDASDMFALVQEELGDYAPDAWRLFAVGDSDLNSPEDYRELDGSDEALAPGDAFWLISGEGGTIQSGPGVSLPTDVPFTTPLNEAWTMLGHPFAFGLPCNALNGTGDVVTYDGNGFVDVCAEEQGLQPTAGYLVYPAPGNEGGIAEIDPTQRGAAGAASASASRTARRDGWSVRVEARSGAAHDRYNRAGVSPAARSGIDRHDRHEPPPIGAFVSASFLPDESPGQHASRLRRDVRPGERDEHAWTLEVRSATGEPVDLHLAPQNVPARKRLHLIDEDAGRVYDVGAGGLNVRLPARAFDGGATRFLTLTAGPDDALADSRPDGVVLSPNAPNPVRQTTTVRFGLPEAGPVRLVVYDMLGRRIATLADGERSAGFHTVRWDGRSDGGGPVASGTYLYRLTAGGTTRSRSLVVVR